MAEINEAPCVERPSTPTPATYSSSSSESGTSQSALVFNAENMQKLSFGEYVDKAKRGRPPGDSAVNSPDSRMTGTETTLPAISTLKRKLLAAREVDLAPTRGSVSGYAVTDTKKPEAIPAVDELLSRYPDLLNTRSKADVVETIVRSGITGATFDKEDIYSYAFNYAQIDHLAEAVMARSALARGDAIKEKGADFKGVGAENMLVDKESANIEDDDPIIEQERQVLSLRNNLLARLKARLPATTAEALGFPELDRERAFRDKVLEFQLSQFDKKRISRADRDLSSALRKYDREEDTLRLIQEQVKKLKADEDAATPKEKPGDIFRSNMAFLEQEDPHQPTAILFEEDYVDRNSSREEMAKLNPMLKLGGPLTANYIFKREVKRKADREEGEARVAAARRAAALANFAPAMQIVAQLAEADAAKAANADPPA